MFRLLPMRGEGFRFAGWAEPSVRRLQAELAALPPEWIVLRNRRIGTDKGPPWVKFIALHPAKGIVLIDLPPADPSVAVEPLDEFLARTGYGAFSAGDPPIVAVALSAEEAAETATRLDQAFAETVPCGIKNANWTEAVADLLVSTPGLMLTRIAPVAAAAVTDPPALPNDDAAPMKPPPSPQPGVTSQSAPAVQIPVPSEPVARAAAQASANTNERPAPFEMGPGKSVWLAASVCAIAIVVGAIGLVYTDWQMGRPPTVAELSPPSPPPQADIVMPAEEVAAVPPVAMADASVPPRKPKRHLKSRSAHAVAARHRTSPADGPAHVFYAIGDWFASLH